MRSITKASLILIAAGLLATSDVNYVKKHDSLEARTEFVSPDRQYSIGINPRDYGFTARHKVISEFASRDIYNYSKSCWLIVDYIKRNDESTEIFDDYASAFFLNTQGAIGNKVYPDEIFYSTSDTIIPRSKLVGNIHGLTADAEFWIAEHDKGLFNGVIYKQKFLLRMTMAVDEKNVYAFTAVCSTNSKTIGTESNFNKFYDSFIKTFNPIKPAQSLSIQ
jgi:hypothetical protein